MDADYINNSSKWVDDDNITFSNLDNPNGFYQYFFDESDSTFYFHISYSIRNLSNNSNIEIAFSSSNSLNSYKIIFNKNRIEDATSNFEKSLKLLSSFGKINKDSQDIYFALQFLNKEDKKLKNDVSVELRIDNEIYRICRNLSFESNINEDNISTPNKEKTTSKKGSNDKKQETKVPKDNKNANNITKFHYNGENNSNNYNQNNNGSNKYNYNNNEEYCENSNIISEINNEKVVIPEHENKVKFSPISKILLSTASLFCITGLGLIIHSLVKSKQNKKAVKKEEDNE